MSELTSHFCVSLLDCTPAEIAWWEEVIAMMTLDCENGEGASEALLERLGPGFEGFDEIYSVPSLFRRDWDPATLGLSDGGQFPDLEQLSLLFTAFLRAFRPSSRVTVYWADVADSFDQECNGGVFVATSTSALFMNTGQMGDELHSRLDLAEVAASAGEEEG